MVQHLPDLSCRHQRYAEGVRHTETSIKNIVKWWCLTEQRFCGIWGIPNMHRGDVACGLCYLLGSAQWAERLGSVWPL